MASSERIPIRTRPVGQLNQSNDEIAVPTSAFEAMSSAFTLAREFESIGAVHDRDEALSRARLEGDLIDAQTLNREYESEQLPHVFSEPMSRAAAETIVSDWRRRRQLEEKVAGAGTLDRIGAFAAGWAGQLSDPYEIAANVVTGRVVTGALTRLAGAGRVGAKMATVTAKMPSAAQAVGREAIEGVVGAAALEPYAAYVNQEYLQDYTVGQVMSNVALGGILGAGVGFAGHHVGGFMSRRRGGAGAHEVLSEVSLRQATMGGRVDVDASLRAIVDETNRLSAEFDHLDIPTAAGRSYRDVEWHTFTRRDGQDITRAAGNVIEEDLGGGLTYFSDRAAVANGHASRSLDGPPGAIHSVELPQDARLLNLDEAAPDDFRAAVAEVLGSSKGLSDASSAAELLGVVRRLAASEDFSTDVVEKINQKVRALGYDGYERQGGRQLGFEGKPHTVVALFDQSRAKPLRSQLANPDLMARPDEAVQRKALDESLKSHLLTNQDEIQRAREIREVPEVDEPQIKQEIAELEAELRELEAQEALDPEVKAAIEAAKEEAAKGGLEDRAFKAAFTCLTRGN